MKAVFAAALAVVVALGSGLAVAGVNPGASSGAQGQSGAKVAPPKKEAQEQKAVSDKEDHAKDKKAD